MLATQLERSAAARERLLGAAAALVAEGGFLSASCVDIGARAGMSRGAVNFHFGRKADLLEALVNEKAAQWQRAIELGVSAARPAGALALLDAHWAAWLALDDGSRLLPMIMYEARGPSRHILETVTDISDRVTRHLSAQLNELRRAGLVRGNLDAEAAAQVLIAAFIGLVSRPPGTAGTLNDAYLELRATVESHWGVFDSNSRPPG